MAGGRFVPPGNVTMTQKQTDTPPERIGSARKNANKTVMHVNQELIKEYDQLYPEKLII